MDFRTATRQPLTLTVNGESRSLPTFTGRDWVEFGSMVDGLRADKATKGLTPDLRYQYLSFYSMSALTFNELKFFVGSPLGYNHIIETCLGKAGISTEDKFYKDVMDLQEDEKEQIARTLANVWPKMIQGTAASTGDTGSTDSDGDTKPLDERTKEPRPLPSSDSDSKTLPATGGSTSPDSVSSTTKTRSTGRSVSTTTA